MDASTRTPLHSAHEQQHSTDGEQASNVIDLLEHLTAGQALAVDTGRRVVEDCGDHKTDESPELTDTLAGCLRNREDCKLIPTYQMAQNAPIHRHEEWYAMSWPQSTEGQNGMMVRIKAATYLPRWLVGASSEVAASAVSSLTPAPTPANTIPA